VTNPAVLPGALASWRGGFADFLDFLATNGGAHRQIEARDFVVTPGGARAASRIRRLFGRKWVQP
jgi:hypothetical protein